MPWGPASLDRPWLAPVLQEEERERRMDFVPEESAVNTENIEVRRRLRCCISGGRGGNRASQCCGYRAPRGAPWCCGAAAAWHPGVAGNVAVLRGSIMARTKDIQESDEDSSKPMAAWRKALCAHHLSTVCLCMSVVASSVLPCTVAHLMSSAARPHTRHSTLSLLPTPPCPAPPGLLNAQVDRDTLEMLKAINMAGLPGVTVAQVAAPAGGPGFKGGFRGGERGGDRGERSDRK